MIKVLLVEDNQKINDNIRLYLEQEFQIQPVFSGEEAEVYLESYSYDLVILDLMLPGKDGLSVLKYISKKQLQVGVIVLTAKEDIGEKLRAFELGAQDYVTKPFFMEELRARMKVILKRLGKLEEDGTLKFKALSLDYKKKAVSIEGKPVELNERLFQLIEFFLLNQGILLFKEQIFERICGYESDAATEIVEVYMSQLRKKLSPYGYEKYFVTKRGMGYILEGKA